VYGLLYSVAVMGKTLPTPENTGVTVHRLF
jgi:hypothetical protein